MKSEKTAIILAVCVVFFTCLTDIVWATQPDTNKAKGKPAYMIGVQTYNYSHY